MLVVGDDPSLGVFDFIRQATGLRAIAAVGAAPGMGMADVAQAAVGHTQRTMNEELEGGPVSGIARAERGINGRNLRQGQLPCQDDLREAAVLQEAGLLRG